jgi:hypothetical protein
MIRYFQQLGQFKNINQMLDPDWRDEDNDVDTTDNSDDDTDSDNKIQTVDDLVDNSEVDPDDEPDDDDLCIQDFVGR